MDFLRNGLSAVIDASADELCRLLGFDRVTFLIEVLGVGGEDMAGSGMLGHSSSLRRRT